MTIGEKMTKNCLIFDKMISLTYTAGTVRKHIIMFFLLDILINRSKIEEKNWTRNKNFKNISSFCGTQTKSFIITVSALL